MTCRLAISLLGSFQARLDGQPISFRSDTIRALLAYLVLTPGGLHHRESLATLLWPDHELATALTNLRQTLSRLARAVGNHAVRPQFLRVDTRTVRFDAASDHQVDVRLFEDRIAQAQTHRHRRVEVCVSCVRALQEAAALYRGEFLSGLALNGAPEFEQWALLQREHLHTQALSALSVLSTYHAQRGEWDLVYSNALRQIELEPWYEPAHRQMMQALAATGRRGAALAQYKSCCQILLENLGVEPEDATQVLYADIQFAETDVHALPGTDLSPYASSPDNGAAHHLPARTTLFVGRGAELAQVSEWLAGPDDRLITFTGLSGCGKTRLALQVAYEQRFFFRDGVFWVSLAGLTDLADVLLAVAHTLNVSLRGPAPVFERLTAHLRDKELLLVLDNCEHLPALGQRIGALLRAAPQLYVLVTSRQLLRIHAERVLVVGGLSSTRAAELFAASVRQIDPGFDLDARSPDDRAAIERICTLVQGHPLALILAAVWKRTLSCVQVADEIAADVDFLGTALHDLPERHQSLRALFEYTWQRMETQEREALSQMSVFRGGFTRQAAQSVCDVSLPMLQALTERSLLQQSGGGQYALHPLVTRFAAEKLDAMSALVVHLTRERHGVYYLTHLAEQGSIFQSQPQVALAEIGSRWPDILAAWRWAAGQARVGLLAASTRGLTSYLMYQGLFQQGEAILGAAARTLAERSSMDSAIRQVYGRLLGEHARFLNALAAYAQAAQTAQQAVAVAAATVDLLGEARGHLARGIALSRLEDDPVAHEELLRALHFFRQAGSRFGESQALNFLGSCANQLDDPAGAQGYHEQALKICREIGDRHGESIVLNSLAGSLYNQGQYVQARDCWQQARDICSQIGNRWDENKAIGSLGTVAIDLGECTEARVYLRQAFDFSIQNADRLGQGIRLHELGIVASCLGDHDRALDHQGQAVQILHEIGELRWEGRARIGSGIALCELGRIEQAETHCRQAIALAGAAGLDVERALALTALGHVLAQSGRLDQADAVYQEAMTHVKGDGRGLAALSGLAGIALDQGRRPQALSHVETILAQIEDRGRAGKPGVVPGLFDSFRVYLACYRVLSAADDPRARDILQTAHALLQKQAVQIEDEETRQAFLQGVSAHREIVEAWQALPATAD